MSNRGYELIIVQNSAIFGRNIHILRINFKIKKIKIKTKFYWWKIYFVENDDRSLNEFQIGF